MHPATFTGRKKYKNYKKMVRVIQPVLSVEEIGDLKEFSLNELSSKYCGEMITEDVDSFFAILKGIGRAKIINPRG